MSPPASASSAEARRYGSMWKRGRRPRYSAMRMKLGEVTVSVTPRPAAKAFARWVLPAPSSPHRHTRSPGRATAPRARPSVLVAAGSGARTRRESAVDEVIASDEPLEIAEGDRGDRPVGEAHGARLEVDPAREPSRPDHARPDPVATA